MESGCDRLPCRPMTERASPCEPTAEVGVARGPRGGSVERAVDVEVLDGEERELCELVEVNPGHPLPPVAERTAEAEAEKRGQRSERAAIISEDDRGAPRAGDAAV